MHTTHFRIGKRNEAVVISGYYYIENDRVNILPKSGYAAGENNSYSVFADNCMLAAFDAYAVKIDVTGVVHSLI